MGDSAHLENGIHKQDIYTSTQSQWLMPLQPSMKQLISIMVERDAAVQERSMAINEKNKALEERDLAIMQRDAAMRETTKAILERDNALSALQYQQNSMNSNNTSCPPGCQIGYGIKHVHHPQQYLQHQSHMGGETSYDPREVTVAEAQKVKQAEEMNPVSPNKRSSKKAKREEEIGGGDEYTKLLSLSPKPDWEGQDIGLNQVAYDDSTMPTPVCSCTGVYHQCYKWGNGGWQSACCTTTISVHPLPAVPNKKHARVGGRKMSGSAFSKLLSRLSAEGHDLSVPVDLKDRWAKHGTNRYVTIK